MPIGVRGGRPVIVFAGTVDTTGRKITFVDKDRNAFMSVHLSVQNESVSDSDIDADVRLYFEEEDFDADASLDADPRKYIKIGTSGLYDEPDELKSIWVRAADNTPTVVVVARARVG